MRLIDCLQPETVVNSLSAQSKKKALELMSEFASAKLSHLKKKDIFEALIARERLGTTALGHGIAIPHCRIPEVTDPVAIFAKLEKPIDYDAPDEIPIDILITLLIPEESTQEHLQLLADIAKIFSQKNNLEHVRKAKDDQSLYNTLVNLHA